ncbi:MAG: 30S ribosomal protein S9 [Bdellovibrionota bacterium]|nr:30S ribosomal protein S9 [Deltaproteobacteria bacterium]
MPKAHYKFTGVGKRKNAIARVYMNKGDGAVSVNRRDFEEYFPTQIQQMSAMRALNLTSTRGKYDIYVRVIGGGVSAQAEAVNYGISKALLEVDPELRTVLKPAGFLSRDARIKERKKYGQPGARKKFQYSKR